MKYVALIPGAYHLITRVNAPRDLLYVIATQWIPGVWLIHRLGEVDLPAALGLFAIGYLAFNSIYEIGYFVNDTWDARRRPNARHRFPYEIGPAYVAVFLATHLAAWTAISVLAGLILMPEWLVGYAILVVVVVLYNTTNSDVTRLPLFIQMTYLRYILPIYIFAGIDNMMTIMFIATILYVYFRVLSFLDAKGFLVMPDRKGDGFGAMHTLMFAPIVIFATFMTTDKVIIETYLIYFSIYGAYYLRSAAR